MAKEKDIKKNLKNEKVKNTKKKDKKTKATKAPKEKYMVGLKREIKNVKWPTFKDIVKYTIATIIFIAVFVLFFELLNIIMAFVKGLFN